MTLPAQALADLRTALLRFAQLQLQDHGLAEDAVSETLLALVEQPARFEGRSSLRTYATGILKFKIVDVLRRRGREVPIEPVDEQSLDDAIDALFQADGHWRAPPAAWSTPEAALERREFFDVLETCLDVMPPRIARIFMMREWLELETDEICQELAITANHCGVMLYRARMQLRQCLGQSWFAGARA